VKVKFHSKYQGSQNLTVRKKAEHEQLDGQQHNQWCARLAVTQPLTLELEARWGWWPMAIVMLALLLLVNWITRWTCFLFFVFDETSMDLISDRVGLDGILLLNVGQNST